jgi:hypothetical protein
VVLLQPQGRDLAGRSQPTQFGHTKAFGSWNQGVEGFPRRGGPSVHKPQLSTEREQDRGSCNGRTRSTKILYRDNYTNHRNFCSLCNLFEKRWRQTDRMQGTKNAHAHLRRGDAMLDSGSEFFVRHSTRTSLWQHNNQALNTNTTNITEGPPFSESHRASFPLAN